MQNQENNMEMPLADNNRTFSDSNVSFSANNLENTDAPKSDLEAGVQYAGFFTRFAAFCIDSLIAGLLLLVVRFPMWMNMLSGTGSLLDTKVLFEFNIWDIIIYLLSCLYYILLTYHSGATIGKKLMRIRVVSGTGEKLTFFDVLYRETIGKFLCAAPADMGYVLIGLDKEKRGFHDMLCDTRVIYDFEVKKKQKEEASIQPSNYGYVAGSQKAADMEEQAAEHEMEKQEIAEQAATGQKAEEETGANKNW